MFWPVLLTGFILIFGGGTAFWLALTCKPKPALFVTLELIAITLLPARFVLGPICGGWLALAFFMERRERIAAPKDRPGWRRVLQDALMVDLIVLSSLVYLCKQHRHIAAGLANIAGLVLVLWGMFCYFRTAQAEIPKEYRIGHGYLTGLCAVAPYLFYLTSIGWFAAALGLGSFLILPPLLLCFADLEFAKPTWRRRRRRRSPAYIKMLNR